MANKRLLSGESEGVIPPPMNAIPRLVFGRYLDWKYGAAPRTVNIESTSHCNAKCLTCPHPDHQRVRGIETVKIISNASALTEKKSRQLIEAGLDEIKISFDGLSKDVFEKIRVGLKYDKIVANLEGLVRLRSEMGRTNPKIQLMFVAIKENEFEEKGFVERWRGIVDRVDVTRAHNWGGNDQVAGASEPKNQTGFQCMRLWRTFTVLWVGRVSICCLDYEGTEILGNLRKNTLREILEGKRLAQIREWHTRGEFGEVSVCANCTAR